MKKYNLLFCLFALTPVLMSATSNEKVNEDTTGINDYKSYKIDSFEKGISLGDLTVYSMDITNTGADYISIYNSNFSPAFTGTRYFPYYNQVIEPNGTLSTTLVSDKNNLDLEYIKDNITLYAFKASNIISNVKLTSIGKINKESYTVYDEHDNAYPSFTYSFQYQYSIAKNPNVSHYEALVHVNFSDPLSSENSENCIFYSHYLEEINIETDLDFPVACCEITQIDLIPYYYTSYISVANIVLIVISSLLLGGVATLLALVLIFNFKKKKTKSDVEEKR